MARISLQDDRIYVSTNWICDNLHVSRNTVSEWSRKGCPKLARGTFDLLDLLQWRGALTDDAAAQEYAQEAISLQEQKLRAETRLKQAQSEIAEFKGALQRGEYVARADVVRDLTQTFTALRAAILALPRRAAGILSTHLARTETAQIEAQLTQLVHTQLTRMSTGDMRCLRAGSRRAGGSDGA